MLARAIASAIYCFFSGSTLGTFFQFSNFPSNACTNAFRNALPMVAKMSGCGSSNVRAVVSSIKALTARRPPINRTRRAAAADLFIYSALDSAGEKRTSLKRTALERSIHRAKLPTSRLATESRMA